MGSGKSATASALAFELGIEIISSDTVRKELAKIPPDHHIFDEYDAGIYAPAFNETTYHELLSGAEKTLQKGLSIILDATFRRKEDRLHFGRLAECYNAPFYIVYASCPENLTRERLDERGQRSGEHSDGRWELFHRQKDEFEQPGAGEAKLIHLETARSLDDNINDILKAMELIDET
jgi:predicted kinase